MPRNPRTRGLVVVVVIGWAATALGLLVFPVVSGEAPDVPWSTVVLGLVVGVWGVRRRRALRRAVELNDEPAPEPSG